MPVTRDACRPPMGALGGWPCTWRPGGVWSQDQRLWGKPGTRCQGLSLRPGRGKATETSLSTERAPLQCLPVTRAGGDGCGCAPWTVKHDATHPQSGRGETSSPWPPKGTPAARTLQLGKDSKDADKDFGFKKLHQLTDTWHTQWMEGRCFRRGPPC